MNITVSVKPHKGKDDEKLWHTTPLCVHCLNANDNDIVWHFGTVSRMVAQFRCM